jgi:zinc transporter ZupT
MPDLTQNQLRAIAGLILLILALFYVNAKIENQNIEFIMIALAGSLIGISLTGNKPQL